MKFGYECVKPMQEELLAFMDKHKFHTLADFKGQSLPYFTTHFDLGPKASRPQSRPESRRRKRKSSAPTANGGAILLSNNPTRFQNDETHKFINTQL